MVPETTIGIPALFYAFAAAAMFYFAYNLRRAFAARMGRPTGYSIRPLQLLRNTLVYGLAQRKVASRQFGYATVMHACLAWGFMELFFATSVDFLVERGLFLELLPRKDTVWFAALNELGGLLLVLGVVLALVRRHSRLRPPTLPHRSFTGRGNLMGDSGILLILLLLGVGGFLTEAARLALEAPLSARASFAAYSLTPLFSHATWQVLQPWLWWSHAALALTLIALLPQTKLFHILMSIANVALTDTTRRGSLRPMGLTELMADPDADPESLVLGVGRVEDFTWKQLLDTQACTECARCTSVCPAHATGSPLSPMKIIQDMRRQLYRRASGGGTPEALVGGLISPEELWACTTCGACVEECPVLIDHIPAIIDMRRFLVLSEGKPPDEAATSLEQTSRQGNPWGFPQDERLKWAQGRDPPVPLMADRREVDVLYWVGCAGAYDPRNQTVTRAMTTILEAAGVDYAVLGTEERCTGDSARRLGEEYVYETLAGQNLETLAKYRFNRIVTACPHCFQTLGSDYRQLGADLPVIHHSEYIQELLDNGGLQLEGHLNERVTYHDACYLGRHNGIYDSPRDVIARTLGQAGELVEASLSREQGFCCGAGGGNMWHEQQQDQRVNLARFDQLAETGATTVATACSFCAIMLDDARKVRGQEQKIAVKDIAELVEASLAPSTAAAADSRAPD